MKILSLDTGGHTGWALLYNKKIYSGNQEFLKLGDDDNGVPLTFFRSWLECMLRLYDVRVVVYEMPHLRGAGSQILVGYVTIIQQLCALYGVKWYEVHSATLKKFATGNGKADKEEMMEAWRSNNKRSFLTDDECDALWLLKYAVNEEETDYL